jgi:acetylornithine/succinyldiaminopimelate/putrescine aminotransferase
VLDEIHERNLLANVIERGEQLRAGLLAQRDVHGVRGRGLLLAAMLDAGRSADVVAAAMAEGLIVNEVQADAIRFAPPLTVTAGEVEEALERFARALG